jgi:hypothetical protein
MESWLVNISRLPKAEAGSSELSKRWMCFEKIK